MSVYKCRFLCNNREIARSINEELNVIGSLYGFRKSNVVKSQKFKDDRILQLASKQLGLKNVDELLNLSPKYKSSRLSNPLSSNRIVYEDSVGRCIDKNDNDIWLGHLRYNSYLCINLESSLTLKSLPLDDKVELKDLLNELLRERNLKDDEDYTVFIYPYMRSNSKLIVDLLCRFKSVLTPLDVQSLIYLSGSTGSSRLLRYIGKSLSEHFISTSNSSITRVEQHAWPWMNEVNYTSKSTDNIKLPLIIDALLVSDVLKYTFENESLMLGWLHKELQTLDNLTHKTLSPSNTINKHPSSSQDINPDTTPEATSTSPSLAESSSNYFPVNGNATPGDRGGSEGGDECRVKDVTSGGLPVADLREAEGEVNKEADGRNVTLCGMATGREYGVDSTVSKSDGDWIRCMDDMVLDKIVQMIVLKHHLDRLGNDYIRVFSDFICERLHRIKSKAIANIAYAIGYSKHLDEFWMFMMAKHIQETIDQYDCDDLTSILDAYSTASLEDHSFYETACDSIKDKFHLLSVHHIAIILRSLAKVRVRDEELLHKSISQLKSYANNYISQQTQYPSEVGLADSCPSEVQSNYSSTRRGASPNYLSLKSIATPGDRGGEEGVGKSSVEDVTSSGKPVADLREAEGEVNRRADGRMDLRWNGEWKTSVGSSRTDVVMNYNGVMRGKKGRLNGRVFIDPYVIASGIVSAGDLDYKGDDLDELWTVLTQRVKDSSFDICAVNWLPLATIVFASQVALKTFLPVWIKHVHYTIQKLRSKTFMMTIQRRHALLRHAFNLEILPSGYVSNKYMKVLDEICNKNYITRREDYIPESSTFHLEVCACLKALDVIHQREINIIPFVMDIVIPPKKDKCIKSRDTIDVQRKSDKARCGDLLYGDLDGFRLKYTRHSPNHRKHKDEIYIYNK